MKIICYGDSNTYGYDPRVPFGGKYDAPWPELLAQKTGWTVINRGLNGREIPRTGVDFPEDTDLLIVMLGTNDLLQFWTAEETAQKMEKFLLKCNLPCEKILLLPPPPMVFGDWVEDQELIDDVRLLGELFEALAQRLGTGFARINHGLSIAHDGVHLTQEAHRAVSESIYLYFTKENEHDA